MAAGDKLLAGIESNKLFLKKHLSRKRAMKISYGISSMIYLLITTLLIFLTIQSYNLYDISKLIVGGDDSKTLTTDTLALIKDNLGVSIDDKFILLGLSVFFGILLIATLSLYISLSKMNYTARPKLWLGTSIILLPLVVPFVVCIIVFTKYIKDKHWKESRKEIKKTIQPILSSVIKEFEDDVLQKEVSVKRNSNEHPGFEQIYNSIKVDTTKIVDSTKLKNSTSEPTEIVDEKPKKLTRKEKKALKKAEKETTKTPKIDESQITNEPESEDVTIKESTNSE